MGFMRKSLSISTAGLVDFRSDKERVARSARLTKRYTKDTRNAARQQAYQETRQTRLLRKQLKAEREAQFNAQLEAERLATAREQLEAQLEAQRHAAARQQLETQKHENAPVGAAPRPDAGWFLDPQNPQSYRWFDGYQWTGHTYPR